MDIAERIIWAERQLRWPMKKVITEKECEQVHKAAVRVLEQGGMRCDDPRAAKMFEKAGC